MTGNQVVRLENLARRFGGLTAVDGLSLAVERGELFGLIGPDGAGKTTTLRMILGLLAPDGGSVETCGLEPFRQRRKLAHHVGYLAQRFSLYGDLSVDENLAFFAAVHGAKGRRQRREALLEAVGLAPFRDRLASRLSGGMKQKLALACTLIHTPELLILDEPTTGVDPVSRREFWKILGRLQRDGLTVIATTPYIDEAERCSRVGLVHRGRLLALDTPRGLHGADQRLLVEVIARPHREAAHALAGMPEVAEIATFGERIHVTLARGAEAAAEAAALSRRLHEAGLAVDAVRAVPPSLEDLFIARIREAS